MQLKMRQRVGGGHAVNFGSPWLDSAEAHDLHLQDHNWLSAIGFLSGILVSIANVLQFLGGQAAGAFSVPRHGLISVWKKDTTLTLLPRTYYTCNVNFM